MIEEKIRLAIASDNLGDEDFNRLALELFEKQYNGIPAYKKLCDRREKSPGKVSHYHQIPAVPTDAFKHLSLFWGPEKKRTFLTSGTTQGQRGAHHFFDLDLYRKSMEGPFKKHLLKDLGVCDFLVLAPKSSDLLESSLSFMISELAEKLAKSTTYFVGVSESGELEMRYESLAKMLDLTTEGVLILGTAFALVGFFDHFPSRVWSLPKGSVVMETGGLKGRSREISNQNFYQLISQRWGISPQHIVSEYSMTELSSQAYTNTLSAGIHWDRSSYQVPSWARVDLVNPVTMRVDNSIERGLIRWFDLANLHSVSAILTSDLGSFSDSGFKLHGRASNAEVRGCSLTIEEILSKD